MTNYLEIYSPTSLSLSNVFLLVISWGFYSPRMSFVFCGKRVFHETAAFLGKNVLRFEDLLKFPDIKHNNFCYSLINCLRLSHNSIGVIEGDRRHSTAIIRHASCSPELQPKFENEIRINQQDEEINANRKILYGIIKIPQILIIYTATHNLSMPK